MTAAIEITSVRKTFGPKVAVDDLSLTIPEGSLIGLIGPNGAGKTTTIRMIMSIIFPDSGDVRVLGRASAVESKDRIGYLPEERGLYKKMKVGAFLTYLGRLKGIDATPLDTKVRSWLDRVGLADCYRKRCEELSKGMQQKVQFIASVLHEPELIILDEPFSGLDPVNSRLLRSLVDEQHRQGRTLIFSTHQMSQAEALCDRIVMIHQGRKVLDNTMDEIRSRYAPHAIRFEPANEADAAQIGQIPGVQSVSRHNGMHAAHLAPGHRPDAAIRLIAERIALHRIEVVRPTLEDVFIEIVSNSARTDEERAELRAMMQMTGAADSSGD